MKLTRQRPDRNQGAVAVEFAIVAPVLLVIVGGLCEMGQAVCGATKIAAAIREGGRLASMDFSGKLEAGQTANQKITQDVLNFMSATGVDTANAQVFIEYAEGTEEGSTFDLASSDNYLQMFRIRAVVPYENISMTPISIMQGRSLTATIAFRRGRNTIQTE